MWNLKASSKLVQQRSQEQSYKLHRKKLKSMQPRMQISSPVQPDFVYTKNKLNMSRRDRRLEIDKHNEILLIKMNAIKDADYNVNKLRPEAQNLKTLNAQVMNTMNEKIATENKKFCEKLLRTKSFYPTNNILDKTDHLEYVSVNISNNARRAMSARNLHSARPKSSYTTFSNSRSISRKKSTENFKYLSRFDRSEGQQNGERPDTAPIFTRSAKKSIVVPQSGRPRIDYNEEGDIETL